MPDDVVEDLLLLAMPMAAFGLLALLAGRRPAYRLAGGSAAAGAFAAGLVTFALAPRCMCRDALQLVIGTGIVGLVAGAGAFALALGLHRISGTRRTG